MIFGVSLMSLLIHCGLEALGGLGLRCILGVCEHGNHRWIARFKYPLWVVYALICSFITVKVIG